MDIEKKRRQRCDYNFLQEFFKENNITLSKDYSNEKVTSESRIEFKCNYEGCNENCNKSLGVLKLNKFFTCLYHSKFCQSIKRKKTCLERFGSESPMHDKSIKEKIKQTCLKRYGVENPSQHDEIKKKYKKTCLKKYGVENPFQSENIKIKIKEVCLEKYGVEYYLQSENKNIKSKKTSLEKYGFEYANQSELVKNKIKNTHIENYGVATSRYIVDNLL